MRKPAILVGGRTENPVGQAVAFLIDLGFHFIAVFAGLVDLAVSVRIVVLGGPVVAGGDVVGNHGSDGHENHREENCFQAGWFAAARRVSCIVHLVLLGAASKSTA